MGNTIRWVVGAVLIALGVPLFFLARYLEAPEVSRKKSERALKVVAIIWMLVGYCSTWLTSSFHVWTSAQKGVF